MRNNTLAMPSLDERLRPDPAEPELDWQFASQPRQPIPAAENGRRIPEAQRSAVPVGSLLYLALVALIAIAIVAVFFGAGFRLLAPPKQTVATSASAPHLTHGDVLGARGNASPAPPEVAAPDTAALASLPAAPEAPRAAPADAPPAQREAPATAVNNPPAQTASAPAPAAGPNSVGAPTPPLPLASVSEPSKSAAAPFSGRKYHASHFRRSHHTQSASRHPHERYAHSGRPLTAPTAEQTRSFDELVSQLTSEPQSDAPTLTPPRPQQPDPFAAPRPN